jgi:nitrilase
MRSRRVAVAQAGASVWRGGVSWSCVVDPFGALLAGPVFDREDVLVADLDLLDGADLDLDVSGTTPVRTCSG